MMLLKNALGWILCLLCMAQELFLNYGGDRIKRPSIYSENCWESPPERSKALFVPEDFEMAAYLHNTRCFCMLKCTKDLVFQPSSSTYAYHLFSIYVELHVRNTDKSLNWRNFFGLLSIFI